MDDKVVNKNTSVVGYVPPEIAGLSTALKKRPTIATKEFPFSLYSEYSLISYDENVQNVLYEKLRNIDLVNIKTPNIRTHSYNNDLFIGLAKSSINEAVDYSINQEELNALRNILSKAQSRPNIAAKKYESLAATEKLDVQTYPLSIGAGALGLIMSVMFGTLLFVSAVFRVTLISPPIGIVLTVFGLSFILMWKVQSKESQWDN